MSPRFSLFAVTLISDLALFSLQTPQAVLHDQITSHLQGLSRLNLYEDLPPASVPRLPSRHNAWRKTLGVYTGVDGATSILSSGTCDHARIWHPPVSRRSESATGRFPGRGLFKKRPKPRVEILALFNPPLGFREDDFPELHNEDFMSESSEAHTGDSSPTNSAATSQAKITRHDTLTS